MGMRRKLLVASSWCLGFLLTGCAEQIPQVTPALFVNPCNTEVRILFHYSPDHGVLGPDERVDLTVPPQDVKRIPGDLDSPLKKLIQAELYLPQNPAQVPESFVRSPPNFWFDVDDVQRLGDREVLIVAIPEDICRANARLQLSHALNQSNSDGI